MTRLYALVLSLLIFLLLLTGFSHSNTALTQDLGRHLLLGKMMLETLTVPRTNLFSYTHPDFPFINHHYLSEVVFSFMESAFGIDSLLYLTIILITLTFVNLYFFAWKKSTLFGLALVSILMLRVLFERTDVRPEIFSFLFASVFLTSLYSFREHPSRFLLFLIPLTLLWTQMHIYFVIGYGLIGLFFIDWLITHRKNLHQKGTGILLVTFLGALAVPFINPNGIEGALYPFRVFQNYGYTIEENQTLFLLESLGFEKPSLPYFKLSVFLLFLSLFISWKKTKPIDWMLAVVFSIGGFMAVRNLPLFALICFIPFANAVPHILSRLSTWSVFNSRKTLLFHGIALLLIGFCVYQIVSVSRIRGIAFSTKDPAYSATLFFKKNNLKGPLFNNFDIGSYLMYRLYPQENVFVDGRPEAYPSQFFSQTYIPIQEDPSLFEQATKHYNFQTIVVSHTDQTPWAETFLKQIVRHPSWVPVYLDQTMLILVKNTPQNEVIIKTYGMTFDTLTFSSYDRHDFASLLQAASFVNRIEHRPLEKKVYADVLALRPTYCPALFNLASILTAEQDPTSVLYRARYQNACLK